MTMPIIIIPTDTSQDSAIDVSVEYINEEAITIKYPARPDGYIAVLLDNDSSEYSPLVFPGTETEYTVSISKGFTSCLSLFPLQENDGILYSNQPTSVFIQYRYQHQQKSYIAAIIVGVICGVPILIIVIPITVITLVIYGKLT